MKIISVKRQISKKKPKICKKTPCLTTQLFLLNTHVPKYLTD